MSVVRMSELLTPESVAMKYICQRLGLNLRPGKAIFDKNARTWQVPLRAIVPSKVSRRDGLTKTFNYTFGVGQLTLDEKLRIRQRMGAQDLEDEILKQWNDLNEIIQREILQYAKGRWGKLTFVQTFLRPVYTLVVAFLDRKKVDVSNFGIEAQKWIDLLQGAGFIEPVDGDMFRTTNILTGLHQRLLENGEHGASNFEVAQIVAGTLFANEYQRIREEFRINAPGVYVDTAKLYYTDAVNFKELIPMGEKELFLKYRQMGNRAAYQEATSQRGFSFATTVSELISVGLLHREQEEEIVGDEGLFDHLVQFRDQISPASESISE